MIITTDFCVQVLSLPETLLPLSLSPASLRLRTEQLLRPVDVVLSLPVSLLKLLASSPSTFITISNLNASHATSARHVLLVVVRVPSSLSVTHTVTPST